MANTPEGRVKKGIIKVLKEFDMYYFMPVQNGMGKPGLDFHCAMPPLGIAVFIEAKAPGKKPTARQVITIKECEAAGGRVFVCDGNLEDLRKWLQGVRNSQLLK